MKKTFRAMLLLSLSFIMTQGAFAQCTKKTDDMTKETKIDTKITKLGGTGAKGFKTPMYLQGSISYLSKEKMYLLYLFPEFSDIKTIQKGSTVYVKFTDESVLQLTVGSTDVSTHSSGKAFTQGTDNTIWTNTVQLELTDADVTALKTKKVAKIRVETEDYNVKNQDVIPGWLECIDKNK